MKKITILTLLMTLALTASAISLPDSLNYTVRATTSVARRP